MNNSKLAITCCLWNNPRLTKKELLDSLKLVEAIVQESHFTRKIVRCKTCGQLYLYQFIEEVDWEGGNDTQFFKWIPVKDIEHAYELSKKTVMQILNLPCIRIDFEKDMENPKGPYIYKFRKDSK